MAERKNDNEQDSITLEGDVVVEEIVMCDNGDCPGMMRTKDGEIVIRGYRADGVGSLVGKSDETFVKMAPADAMKLAKELIRYVELAPASPRALQVRA